MPSTDSNPTVPDSTPREARLTTIAEQTAAIDLLIALAQHRIRVFDVDLSQCGWNSPARAEALAQFLRAVRERRLDIIVHDTSWIERSGARLRTLLSRYGHSMTIYKTGVGARHAMDPLIIVDDRHFLHRYHASQPRATLAIDMPEAARPWVTRFDEIWATGEPGVQGTTLGL